MVAHCTTGGGPKQAMMACHVTGHTADGGTGEATDRVGITRHGERTDRYEGGQSHNSLHDVCLRSGVY